MIKTTMSLHSNKDGNHDLGNELGLSGKALDYFLYALSEVCFDVEINEETGECTITHCNGKKLENKES